MKDNYTIGQLASLAGTTRKALRVYEQKGLLVPLRNSDNGYRLYGADAVKTMEKVQLMRYLDFSLDQIAVFLKSYENVSRENMLTEQKRLLEKKVQQLGSVIACVDRAILECQGEEQDNEAFLRSLSSIVKNQRADELVMGLIPISNEPYGWARFVFDKAMIKSGMSILDAGAGYGNLWRCNSDRFPKKMSLTCVDRHNTHMDSFKEFAENDEVLKHTDISFVYDDLESMTFDGTYDRIFFNHVAAHISDRTSLYRKLSEALSKDGAFVCTWGGLLFYEKLQPIMKGFLSEDEYREFHALFHKHKESYEHLEGELNEAFGSVERYAYKLTLHFDTVQEMAKYMQQVCHPLRDICERKYNEFISYLDDLWKSKGTYELDRDTYLYYCRK